MTRRQQSITDWHLKAILDLGYLSAKKDRRIHRITESVVLTGGCRLYRLDFRTLR